MFLDKLWMRIKGELLALREDSSAAEDLRNRADQLLERLQERLRTDRGELAADGNEQGQSAGEVRRHIPPPRTLAEIEAEWRELMSRKNQQSPGAPETEPPPPNPRRLG